MKNLRMNEFITKLQDGEKIILKGEKESFLSFFDLDLIPEHGVIVSSLRNISNVLFRKKGVNINDFFTIFQKGSIKSSFHPEKALSKNLYIILGGEYLTQEQVKYLDRLNKKTVVLCWDSLSPPPKTWKVIDLPILNIDSQPKKIKKEIKKTKKVTGLLMIDNNVSVVSKEPSLRGILSLNNQMLFVSNRDVLSFNFDTSMRLRKGSNDYLKMAKVSIVRRFKSSFTEGDKLIIKQSFPFEKTKVIQKIQEKAKNIQIGVRTGVKKLQQLTLLINRVENDERFLNRFRNALVFTNEGEKWVPVCTKSILNEINLGQNKNAEYKKIGVDDTEKFFCEEFGIPLIKYSFSQTVSSFRGEEANVVWLGVTSTFLFLDEEQQAKILYESSKSATKQILAPLIPL